MKIADLLAGKDYFYIMHLSYGVNKKRKELWNFARQKKIIGLDRRDIKKDWRIISKKEKEHLSYIWINQFDMLCENMSSKSMNNGDIVIVMAGLDRILGVGRIVSPHRYIPHYRDQSLFFDHVRSVEWLVEYDYYDRKKITPVHGFNNTLCKIEKGQKRWRHFLGIDFELEMLESPSTFSNDNDVTITELEDIQTKLTKEAVEINRYKRSRQLVERLKKLYGYRCQLCSSKSIQIPEIPMKNGRKYVEVHHINGFNEVNYYEGNSQEEADYLIDNYKNVVVLCAYHHKLIHKYKNGFTFDVKNKRFESKDNLMRARAHVRNSVQKLYDTETSSTSMYSLIMGDDVDDTNEIKKKRRKVNWRKKTGWVDEGSLQDKPVLEVYYIDVGQGDSTFIVTPARKTVLIDGGENFQALKFLSWKYRLSERDLADMLVIDLLVLTHPDEDHINGLIHVLNNEKIQVNKIIHSGVGVYKESAYKNKTGELTPFIGRVKYLKTIHSDTGSLDVNKISKKFKEWKDAIDSHPNLAYERVDSITPSFNLDDPDVTFEILGPIIYKRNGEDTLRWFSDCPKNRNGNSVIVKLTYDKTVFLFSGDVNEISQKKYCEDEHVETIFNAHVLKAPHHGSHEYHDEWLMAVNPQISIISSGDNQDHGHPRAVFLGKIGQVSRSESPLLFSTEIARTFVDVKDNLKEEFEVTDEVLENIDNDLLEKIRLLYKKRLNGMINIRSDGKSLFTARRISSGQRWEYYDNIDPAPRTDFKKNDE